MAIINIETATTVCSVAVSDGEKILFEKTSFDGPSHASLLGVFVDEAVDAIQSSGIKVDAVAVSSGPGSYTGLRIGVSMAKGLCFGRDVPLLSIPTLDILASKAIRIVSDNASDALFCPMLDARRMEVYAALFDRSLRNVRDTKADIVTEETYASFLAKQPVYFFGNGAAKCKQVIQSSNALFLDDIHPLASDMAVLSEQALADKRFENVAYFEPFYLKEFVATVAKNKVFPEN